MNDSDRKLPDRAVRVEDVARVAGVSPITVSRALRTPEKVKPATLERVLQAVKETGYQINAIASSLRSGQSAFVTVFVAAPLAVLSGLRGESLIWTDLDRWRKRLMAPSPQPARATPISSSACAGA